MINSLPHMAILGASNSTAKKAVMSKIWRNGGTIYVLVENILGKEEIARYKQFLVFPQCFQKLYVVDASK